MALTGDRIVAVATAIATAQNTAGTTTSTSYTATLTGGTTCGVAFVAPPSGTVLVLNTSALGPGGVIYNYCDFEMRTGGVVGSGTINRAASDTTAIRSADPNFVRFTGITEVTGLTVGSTYNVRQMFRVASGTGTFQDKRLAVQPQL